jgi:hypothetical protein
MMMDSVREGRYYPGIPVDGMRSIIQGHGKTKLFHGQYEPGPSQTQLNMLLLC